MLKWLPTFGLTNREGKPSPCAPTDFLDPKDLEPSIGDSTSLRVLDGNETPYLRYWVSIVRIISR